MAEQCSANTFSFPAYRLLFVFCLLFHPFVRFPYQFDWFFPFLISSNRKNSFFFPIENTHVAFTTRNLSFSSFALLGSSRYQPNLCSCTLFACLPTITSNTLNTTPAPLTPKRGSKIKALIREENATIKLPQFIPPHAKSTMNQWFPVLSFFLPSFHSQANMALIYFKIGRERHSSAQSFKNDRHVCLLPFPVVDWTQCSAWLQDENISFGKGIWRTSRATKRGQLCVNRRLPMLVRLAITLFRLKHEPHSWGREIMALISSCLPLNWMRMTFRSKSELNIARPVWKQVRRSKKFSDFIWMTKKDDKKSLKLII